jgi:hypothetical protein
VLVLWKYATDCAMGPFSRIKRSTISDTQYDLLRGGEGKTA